MIGRSVTTMSPAEAGGLSEPDGGSADVAALIPMVRRIVGARVGGHPTAEDLVQETLVRVLAPRDRIEPGMLEPYAIVTARNVVASMWRQDGPAAAQPAPGRSTPSRQSPTRTARGRRGAAAIARRSSRLSERERHTLLAHEVAGQDTQVAGGASSGSTAGAVAAQLNRTRARLRVEYLLALEDVEPPTDRCRPVLLALSAATAAGRREVGRRAAPAGVRARARGSAGRCMERGQPRDDEVRIPITGRRRHRRGPQARPRAGGAGWASPAPS